VEALRKAVDNGYRAFGTLENNRDFDSLKNSPEFLKIIEGLKRQ